MNCPIRCCQFAIRYDKPQARLRSHEVVLWSSRPDESGLHSHLEFGAELFRNRLVLEPGISRQSVPEWRIVLAPHERGQIRSRLGRDAEAIRGDVIAWEFFLDVGDLVERRDSDLPPV